MALSEYSNCYERGIHISAFAGKVLAHSGDNQPLRGADRCILPDRVLESNSGDLLAVLISAVLLTSRKHETCLKMQKSS